MKFPWNNVVMNIYSDPLLTENAGIGMDDCNVESFLDFVPRGGSNSIVMQQYCKVLQYFGIAKYQSIAIRIEKSQSIAILIGKNFKYCKKYCKNESIAKSIVKSAILY